MSRQELPGGRGVEGEGMKVTVIGAAIIVAAFIAAVLLLGYLNNRTQQPRPPEGSTPGQ